MRQWIDLAEHIFQRRLHINEKKQIKWYFPVQRRQEKVQKQGIRQRDNMTEKSHLKKKPQIQMKLNFTHPSQRPQGG